MINYWLILFTFSLLLPNASTFAKNESWTRVYKQDFESGLRLEPISWIAENYQERGRYADAGAYHKRKKLFKPPKAYRATYNDEWIKYEFYSRSKKSLNSFFNIVLDPENKKNNVLKLSTQEHTDGFIIGSLKPLPRQYKVCARGGYASFGNGTSLPNGYNGDEKAEPWISAPSINENGHYWLAILNATPKPRNNIWIHHHRKIVIDSDNNIYPEDKPPSWTKIWNGKEFIISGNRPVMMFALDAKNKDKSWNFDRVGMPFISYSAGKWNSQAETNEIRAVDAYLPNQWYHYCIWKTKELYGLEMSGKFKYVGRQNLSIRNPFDKGIRCTQFA